MNANSSTASRHLKSGPPEPRHLETWMWIGPKETQETSPAYEFCQRHASQIAVRDDLPQAIRRPAINVKQVIWSRTVREEVSSDQLDAFDHYYVDANRIQLLGPLCLGWRGEPHRVGWQRIGWHRWRDVLIAPHTQEHTGPHASLDGSSRIKRSVIVVASHYAIAEPLLEMAEAAGWTASWTATANSHTLRGFDTVWWDDSAAPAATTTQWRNRMSRFSANHHAWICTGATHEQHTAATEAGIEMVMCKPFEATRLLTPSPSLPRIRAAA